MRRPSRPSMKQIRDSRATTSSSPRWTTSVSGMLSTYPSGRSQRLLTCLCRPGSVGPPRGRSRRSGRFPGVPPLLERDGGCGPERQREQEGAGGDQEDEPVAPPDGEGSRDDGPQDGREPSEGAVESQELSGLPPLDAPEEDERARRRVEGDRDPQDPEEDEVETDRHPGDDRHEGQHADREIAEASQVGRALHKTIRPEPLAQPSAGRKYGPLPEAVGDVDEEDRGGADAYRVEVRGVGDVEEIGREVEQEPGAEDQGQFVVHLPPDPPEEPPERVRSEMGPDWEERHRHPEPDQGPAPGEQALRDR